MAERDLSIVVRAKDEASKVLKDVGNSAEESSKMLDLAKKGMVAFGVAATAAAAAVAGFAAKSFKDFVDTADAMAKMSIKTGIAVEELSKLRYAGELSGASLDQITGAINKMNVGLISGGKVSDEMAKALKGVHSSVQDVMSGTPTNAFMDIAAAIASVENPAQRAKLAVEAFGKSGVELLPLLTSDIGAAAAEAERLGLVVSTDAANASEKFNDNMTRVSESLKGFGYAIANEMLPWLGQLAEKLAANAMAFMDWLHQMGGIEGIRDKVVSSVNDMLKKFDEKTKLLTHLKYTWEQLVKFFNEVVMPAWNRLMLTLEPMRPFLNDLIKLFGTGLVVALHLVIALIEGSLKLAFALLAGTIDTINAMVQAGNFIWQTFTDKLKGVWEWVNNLIDKFRELYNAIKQAMEAIGSGQASGAFSSALSAAGSIAGTVFNAVTPFAEGGIVTRPTLAMIGEAGEAEAVIPLSKLGQMGGGGMTVNVEINGGYFLSEDAARDIGDSIMRRLKLAQAV